MPRRIAFIAGITGQDGSYLANLLLAKDYDFDALVNEMTAAALAAHGEVFAS